MEKENKKVQDFNRLVKYSSRFLHLGCLSHREREQATRVWISCERHHRWPGRIKAQATPQVQVMWTEAVPFILSAVGTCPGR